MTDLLRRGKVRRMTVWKLVLFFAVCVGPLQWTSETAVFAKPVQILLTSFEKFGMDSDNASRAMVVALIQDLEHQPLSTTNQSRQFRMAG